VQAAAAAAAPAEEAAVGAGGRSSRSRRRSRPVVEYSKVWRAVHEWLTGEDEDLLLLVSQVVPYSLAGRGMRAQGDTLRQLQQLAGSRPVPEKVGGLSGPRCAWYCVCVELYSVCSEGGRRQMVLTSLWYVRNDCVRLLPGIALPLVPLQ
jgi:hypothetical protein